MVGEPRARPAVYGGLFFTTLSTLMYEILLTRIFSVTMWYHFAFVAVSVALFGMTVGALAVYLLPAGFPRERTTERLFQASLLFSVSMVLSFRLQLAVPFDPRWSVISLFSISFIYLITSVPFVFSGIAVCLALTRFSRDVSRLYAIDLIGAGLGTVTLIWLLNLLEDGPSAVLASAAMAALGAVCFGTATARRRVVLAGVCTMVLAGLAVGNAYSVQNHHPLLRVHYAKGQAEGVPLVEQWNAYSRVRVWGNPNFPFAPSGWGLSAAVPKDLREQRLNLDIDAGAATVLIHYDGTPRSIEHLRYDVVNVVHYLRPNSNVFVIGSGGGRDVMAALLFRQKSVTAIELNKNILELVNGRYGDYTGHLDRQPGVHFVNDEARSYLTRSDDRYDIIQISLIDTWAATAAGAFALSENSLYTVEAWQTFLNHLAPQGVLSVSRWFNEGEPLETYRLTALAAKALRERGISSPRDHILLIRSATGPNSVAANVFVATILVSDQPFSAADVEELQGVAARLRFEMVLAPEPAQSDPLFASIAAAGDPNTVHLGVPADISAPTDDRPYFFLMLGYRDVFDPHAYTLSKNLTQPVLVLFSLSLAVIGLTLLCILFPLALATSRRALQGTILLIVFFCSIGLGFLLLEISQMQRLIIFLGHPTYALSVVLFSLLVFSGLGSLATERLTDAGRSKSLLLPFAALLVVLATFGLVTTSVIDASEGATTPARIAIAAAILAPMGFLMGMPFPLGMKVAALRPNAPTTFFWGINGATSVCASVLAVAISLGWGVSAAFWVGFASYVIATSAISLTVLRQRI